MTEQQQEDLFTIDTLGKLLQHLAKHEDVELGNREIIYTLLAREIQECAFRILRE